MHNKLRPDIGCIRTVRWTEHRLPLDDPDLPSKADVFPKLRPDIGCIPTVRWTEHRFPLDDPDLPTDLPSKADVFPILYDCMM